jgi:hypothetical protein
VDARCSSQTIPVGSGEVPNGLERTNGEFRSTGSIGVTITMLVGLKSHHV